LPHDERRHHFETRAIHDGQPPDPTTGAVIVPIYQTSTYVQEAPGRHKGFYYARSNHPTRLALERNLAAREGAEHGLAFASGLAAETTVIALLQAGDHVVCGRDVYGGTYRLFTKVFERFGVEFTFINIHRLAELEPAIRKNTRFVWLESPSNPMLTVTDLAEASRIAKARTSPNLPSCARSSAAGTRRVFLSARTSTQTQRGEERGALAS
jgi:cystathionine beta-lyase/cystathionine gamma-synthase